MQEFCFYQTLYIQFLWDWIELQSVLIAKECIFATCIPGWTQ